MSKTYKRNRGFKRDRRDKNFKQSRKFKEWEKPHHNHHLAPVQEEADNIQELIDDVYN